MTEIRLPPIKNNKQGQPRKVGFELEYVGIPLLETARLIADIFPGEIVEETRSSVRLAGTTYGDFTIMLDMAMMQKLSASVAEESRLNPDNKTLKSLAEQLLGPLVSNWVPNEIVTPPLPLEALAEVDKLSAMLRENGGKGTRASPLYAFGLHINAEIPDIPLERLRDYIAAFVLMQERLQNEGRMDFTRQVSQFAKLFPEEYAEYILRADYRPDFPTLIDDYIRFNPTRNRALDMLPAFMKFEEARVKAKVADVLVRPRPTFHYRLPNCDLDNPEWSVIDEWNLWVKVEELAEDPDRLAAMSLAFLA